jgi:hypothetical protein
MNVSFVSLKFRAKLQLIDVPLLIAGANEKRWGCTKIQTKCRKRSTHNLEMINCSP